METGGPSPSSKSSVDKEPDDGELVRRYVEGDPSSFEILVRRHERRVYNIAYRMLSREDDARDATQEAFMTALRKLSSFRGEAAFTTWIHRVTVNACYDILRRRQREPVTDPAEGAEPAATPFDHAEATAQAIDVQRALARVPDDFRAALILHDVQDLPYEEVAEALGVPVGTVKSRIHRGRVALARALGERGLGPREPDATPAPSEETTT
jgi:RNA polymerase sigma-70 factor, ECF subfamily